jgi:outer membrane protein OmpA-like peptidoglycan-associated protein
MKKSIISLILLLGFSVASMSQKDDRKKFVDAEELFMNNEFEKALPLYISIYNADTSNYNAAYRIGMCYLADPQKRDRAILFLEKASKNISPRYREGSYKETKAHPDAMYYLAFAYQLTLKLQEAIDAYTDYSNSLAVEEIYEYDKTARKIDACYRAIEMLKKPRSVEIQNVGEAINTGYAEFNPCLTADGRNMIFTRTMFSGAGDAKKPVYKIMQSEYDGKKWSQAKDITELVGSKGDFKTLSISANGDFLLLHKESFIGSVSDKGDIYMTRFIDKAWTPIQKLPSPINTEHRETHASISSSGSMLYFTSDRPGGTGGIDIYGAARYEDGTFGEPYNLGEVINTPYNEETPFLINDSLLFFSSEGHDNMGELDVFFSKISREGIWTSPVNMGTPVNLTGDDLFFVPIKNGQEGFYAVERHQGYKSYGRQDIYHIKLDIKDKVETVKIAGSFAMDDNNELIPRVFISLVDPRSGKKIKTVEPNYKTGAWDMEAPSGDYNISITADNYDDLDKTIHVPRGHNIEVKAEFKLKPKSVTSGEFLTVKAIFFDYGSADLSRVAQQELERLFLLMDKNPSLYIEVIGYTDSRGSASFNRQLSLRRSRAAIEYLVKKGIEESRFVSSGKGAQDFVALNINPDGTDNPEGRKLNRRVEINIIKSDNTNIIVENVAVPDGLRYKEFVRYSIQIAKTARPLADADFARYKAAGLPAYQTIESKGSYTYYTGDFTAKSKALELLNRISEAGFENASITDYFELNKQQDFKVTKPAAKAAAASSETFTIQLRASSRPLPVASTFPNLAGVREFLGTDQYYRYTTGSYTNMEQAQKAREDLISKGYRDAFVVSAATFNRMEEIIGGVSKAPAAPRAAASPAAQRQFTVQIIAMKRKVAESYFKGLDNVVENIGADGFYRYHVGVFSSWAEAEKAQKEIEAKGFKGAYIVNLDRYR